MAEAITITIPDDPDDTVTVDPVTGDVETRQEDGGVVVSFNAAKKEKDDEGFYANLADDIDQQELARIAEDLLEGIQADDTSRQGYLENRARGLELLGLELKDPKSTVTDGSNPVEGMSSVTNPLLLEAILKGWANSVGEFLPANGPVKIADDGDQETVAEDDLAETLERDMNHYLTVGSPEYYPETSHMLLWGTYFGGSGFKKVCRCPMRRRPLAETVDAQDLIVSDTTKDLKACARITHRIFMRPSVMKRMQLLGHYRDVTLTQPMPQANVVDNKEAQIQGTRALPDRQEDQPFELYETQCELDIPQYAEGTKFEGEKLPLPYLVTVEKESREILAIRRDWGEDDEECQRLRMYVKYPYVPGPGFYGTGLLNILGNASAAMTAAWREGLDAGMFASFPGGLVAKQAGRQNTTFLRPGPGEFVPVEIPTNMPINQAIMPLPYRDVTGGLMSMMQMIQEQAARLGGSIDVPTQEGIQNVPVGTMLAHIEQATKVTLATHKGMHTAQSEELELIVDLFRAHPEDFWRALPKNAKAFWNEQKLLQALDDVALTPRSDPNTPSHIHRIAKALGLVELAQVPIFTPLLNTQEILKRVLAAMREDPQGLVQAPPPQPPVQDLKGQAAIMDAQTKRQKLNIDAAKIDQQGQLEQQKAQDEKEIEGIRLQKEEVIHQQDAARADRESQADLAAKAADIQMQREAMGVEHAKFGLAVHAQQHKQGLAEQAQQHGQGLAEAAQRHAQGVAEYQAMNPPETKDGKE